MNSNVSLTRRLALKSLAVAAGLVALGGLSACGSAPAEADASKLVVAASPAPHAQILTDFAAPALKEQGIELVVKEYTDYILPNKDTDGGSVDANYFQHINYLDNYNAENGTDLVSAGAVHYEPMAVYAGKSADLDAIADGAVIAVPNDPTNEGRALLLLQDLGLIKLSDPEDLEATPKDIAENPYNLVFQELEAGYHVEDALAHEETGSRAVEQYANIVCTAADHADDPQVKALVELLQSDDFKAYLEANYGQDVLPAF